MKNKKNISIFLISLIVLLFCLIIIWSYRSEKQNKIASENYYTLIQLAGKDSKSINSTKNKLQTIVLNNQNAEIVNLALISIAHLNFELGEYNHAIKTYKLLVSKLKTKDLLMPLVLSGLKLNYQKLGLLAESKEIDLKLKKLGF